MFKLNLQPQQYLWFTSDTHYNHSNLCTATTKWRDSKGKIPDNVRKFDSLDKMNDTIVNNINKCVEENDILIHLGDVSFGGFEYIQKFRERIICKNIYLVTGNHDHHILNNKGNVQSLFTEVFKHYVEIEIDGKKFILSHYPIASWNGMAKGVPHLFGHVHLPPNQRLMPGKSMDVGLDGNNMQVIGYKEILSIMDKQSIKPLILPGDHHVDEWREIDGNK